MTRTEQALTVFLLVSLSACASADAVLMDPGKMYPRVENVQLLFNLPDRPYEVIAMIEGTGSVYNDESDVIKAMRKKAGKVGAHAIIFVSTDLQYMPQQTFANPVQGSPPISIAAGNKITSKAAAIRFTDQ